MIGAGCKNFLDLDLISRSSQQLSSGHMAQDRHVGICNSPQNALGLRASVHAELAMDACNDEVEAGKHIIGVVERPVRQDVQLDSVEDAEFATVRLLRWSISACWALISSTLRPPA